MLIDITRLADRHLKHRLPTGIDRVSLAYLCHFRERARAMIRFGGRWLEFDRWQSVALFDALQDDSAKAKLAIRHSVARAYLAWGKQQATNVFLNSGHSGLDQPGYAFRLKRRGLRPIFFLHDLIPISHPEYCRPGEAEKHHRRLDTMLAAGDGLIANSQATRDDLIRYGAQFDRQLPPIVVAPLAAGSLPPPDEVVPLNRPYFVVLGTIEPRKNHLLLLHLWRQLVAELGDAAPKLVVIGQRGWECEQVVDLLDRCEALQGHVIELSRCNDRELATWLVHAQALLFPSFIEGFGMPLVEALVLGVPVIASDLPVFREIAGDIPRYLDPLDGPGWRQSVLEFMQTESVARQIQIGRMASYAPPTWKQHFEVVEDLLRTIDASA